MMAGRVEYRFVIKAFTPGTIPQARLGEYLKALADLYGQESALHFIGLADSSLAILSAAEPDADDDIVERLQAARDDDGPPDARRALARVQEMVREDRGPARIERAGSVVIEFASGERRPDALVYGPFWQHGHLTGEVILIGGKGDPVSVRLQIKNETITCKAKRDVAKSLREHMWGAPVRVEGQGKWIRDDEGNWKMLAFQITSFDPLDDEPLTATVARLRAIEGKWKDRPDPLSELAALRNGETEN